MFDHNHICAGMALPTITADKTSVEITVTFKPLLQNGLLLLVTTADQSTALFTVGIFNGEVHKENITF